MNSKDARILIPGSNHVPIAKVSQLSQLSPQRMHLVERIQVINYGRLTELQIRDGEPVFDPPPIERRTIVFGMANGPNAARDKSSFTLKNKLAELFEIFDREDHLLIEELVIEDGLPVRMTIADARRV